MRAQAAYMRITDLMGFLDEEGNMVLAKDAWDNLTEEQKREFLDEKNKEEE